MEQFLYRGVSKEMYEKSGGKLIPRGSNIEVTMTRSDHNPDEHVELLRNGRFLRKHS